MILSESHASVRNLWIRSGFIAAVLLIVLAVVTGAWLWLDRARTLHAGERSARALARVLEEQTARGLQAVDLTLAGISDVLTLSPGLGEHNPAFEDTLRERLKSLPEVRALFVIGPDGFITQDTDHPNTPRVTLADRDYFIAHAADPSLTLRIGKPLISRSVGAWFVSVSRRISRPDGRFGGIAVAAIEPRYFQSFYRELDLGEHDRIGLYRRDGILLVGTPYDNEAVGKDYSALSLFQTHLPGKAEGTYRVLSPIDQTLRIVSYRAVPGFPLVVAVALAEDDLLAGWRRNAAVIASTAGLVATLIILLLTLRVRRQTEREQALQHQIQAREQSVRSALRMAMVLESTTDAIIELDRDWRVTFLNERARSLLPNRRDVTGQVLWEAYPELVGTDIWEHRREIMDANEACEFEIAGPLAGYWYVARAFPSHDGLAVFFQDVTARRQAEQERERLAGDLEQERTLLKGVLAHLPSGVIAAAAPDGRFVLHNAAAERLLGQPIHIAQNVDDYVRYGAIHPDGSPYCPEEYPLVRALLHGEIVAQEEMLYRLGDGSRTTFTVSAAPVQDQDGRTVMAVITFQDISERKRMEGALHRSEERYRGLVETQTDLIVRIGADGRFTFVNDTTSRIFGCSREDLLNSHWSQFVHPDDADAIKAAIEESRTSPDHRTTVEARIATVGGIRWYAWEGYALFDDADHFIEKQSVGRDITDHKAMEKTLRHAKEVAEQANLAKSKFLAASSHDLRQPVQSLILFQAALTERLGGHPGFPMLEAMGQALSGLRMLLDSLLDISKLDAGLVVAQPVEMPIMALLERLVAEYRPRAIAKHLRLRVVDTNAAVRSDPILLERILRNLIENALRYTEHGSVLLGCRRRGERLRIEVVDTGIGIEPDRQAEIFEEFFQVGNPERDRTKGLGLGLAVVRRLARLLGHEVKVRSVPGSGSTFSVEVPLVIHAAPAGPPTFSPANEDGHGLILVIDDEVLVRMGLQTMLEGWGYRVVAAGSVEEAVRHVESGEEPHAILADYRLRGGETGLDAIRVVHARLDARVPAIVITGDTAPERLVEVQAGGFKLVHKPVTAPELRKAVAEMMQVSALGKSWISGTIRDDGWRGMQE